MATAVQTDARREIQYLAFGADDARKHGESGSHNGDVPAATAILNRFQHYAEFITITGRSYRLAAEAKTSQSAHRHRCYHPTGQSDQFGSDGFNAS